VVVVVVLAVVVFFFLLLFFFVVVVASVVVVPAVVVVPTLSSFSFGRGGIPSWEGMGGMPPPFSTQQRMLALPQSTFSRTWSQIREAMEWMHFPGQSDTVAVLVTEPRKPDKKLLKPPEGLGLGLLGGGILSSISTATPTASRHAHPTHNILIL